VRVIVHSLSKRVDEQPAPVTVRAKCDEIATDAKSKELDSIAVE